MNIIGNIKGGTGAQNAFGLSLALTGVVSVTGTIAGGSGGANVATAAHGISIDGNNKVYITGTIIGDYFGRGVYSDYNCELHVSGTITSLNPPATIVPGVQLNAGILYIDDDTIIINKSPISAILATQMRINHNALVSWLFFDEAIGTKTLYTAGISLGNPLEADVRKDTDFGPNDEFTGTLAVPPPESVVKNVPVDNTIGTWAFTDELINRLRNCSTTEITGQQIASANAAPVEIIPNYEKRFAQHSEVYYCGTAVNGTMESSPTWNLTRLTINSIGESVVARANDSWDNYLTATYV